jgi:perosamine synthetase
VACAQIKNLKKTILKKRSIGNLYNKHFNQNKNIEFLPYKNSYATNIYWVYGLVLDESLGINAEKAMKRLAAKGVGSRPFFYPMHQQPVLRNMGLFNNESYPVAERMYEQGFYIPSGMSLTQNQIEQVSLSVREVLNG